jgi:predicted O-linked N-acetylglucosamine transferase (SPINDLY family)
MSRALQLLQAAFNCQDAGRLDEAEALLEQVLALEPDNVDALHELGLIRLNANQTEQGLSMLSRAADASPDNARFWMNLAIALKRAERFADAIPRWQRAIELSPNDPMPFDQLANCLRELGRLHEAVDAYERLHGRFGPTPIGLSHLGQVLNDQGKIDEAIEVTRRALELQPTYTHAHSNLLLLTNYSEKLTDQEIAAEHRRFGARFPTPPPLARPLRTGTDHRIRIGYLSPDFRQHSVAFFIWRILGGHDRARFDVRCYSDVAKGDVVTEHLRKLPEHWLDVAGVPDKQLADRIAADQLDILVEIAGHTAHNRLPMLGARRLAPVQVSYLGYPNTTGLSTIDYRITDAIADPPGTTDSLHSEKLIRLPDAFFCYVRPGDFPDVVPPPVTRRSDGVVTFAVFANFPKVRPPMMELWAKILHRVARSRLMFQNKSMQDPPTRDALVRFFTDRGIAADRIDPRGWLDFPDHLRLHGDVDIFLDTAPFAGHTTTCHAMWMGVPVITLPGRPHRSRMGASVLTNVGLQELIAGNEDDYVRIACELAADVPRLSKLRASLRQRMVDSPLLDGPRFVRNLESAYEQMLLASTES